MPIYNIHIYPNPILYASRVIKIVQTISKLNKFNITIFGLDAGQLAPNEYLSDTIQIKRCRLFFGIGTSITLFKIAQAIEFSLCVLFSCLTKDIKIIDIHTLSTLPVGLILKFIKKAKLIYNVHELETKKLGWGIYRQLLSRLFEKFFINFVDRMIVVSPEIARWYENAFNIKATIILNAVCTQRQTKHHNFLNVRFHLPSDSVIFVYVGSLSAGRGIDLLIEVFGQLNSLDKVVIFIGYGDYQDKIVEAQRNYKNIFYHPALASHDISKFISAAHFGLALIENLCLSYYYSLPTKIFDYISAGIPVICSSMLEISRLVDTHEIGIIIDELTVDRVREVIEKVDKNTSRKYAENVLKVQSFYTWENEEKKLLQIYNSLT